MNSAINAINEINTIKHLSGMNSKFRAMVERMQVIDIQLTIIGEFSEHIIEVFELDIDRVLLESERACIVREYKKMTK